MFEQYVVFGYSDYMKNALADILKRKDVVYIDSSEQRKITKNILRLLSTSKIWWIIQLILLQISPKSLIGIDRIERQKKTCYIFYEGSMFSHNKAFNIYLRSKHKESKFVHIYTNIIRSNDVYDNLKTLLYLKKHKMYDMIITFNLADANKYNLVFFEQVFSKVEVDEQKYNKSDIFFCGIDKGRLDIIIQIYERLTSNGIVCDFNIVGVKQEKQKYASEIKYHDKLIPNSEMLSMLAGTNCILEILSDTTQPGASLRMSESIVFGKKLITNNKFIKESTLFNGEQMLQFHEVNDIDFDFIKKKVDHSLFVTKEKISPIRLLEFLDLNL